MLNITIDNISLNVPYGTTILQACQKINIEIPRFCYHEKLSIAGNCRMCLVEVSKSPKPVASCAMPVLDGMIVFTNSSMVKKAREGVMEFLLVNHPLDCPICDQGGECDLQDQALLFGNDRGRYYETKRAVENKNWGPLIKTVMTRCIHCTRCVRFANEIAGVTDLGISGRGRSMEISTYVTKSINSELSGNLIDICPVGALTSKPYAFTSRSWELNTIDSIDILDSTHSNIYLQIRNNRIMRIIPKVNEFINEEWIHDKSRFSYDGFHIQRLNFPMVKVSNKLTKSTWEYTLSVISNKLKSYSPSQIATIAGQLSDLESLMTLKDLYNKIGSTNTILDCDYTNSKISDLRPNYLFNTTIENINKSDICLLIGVNPKIESPIINLRLQKAYNKKKIIIGSIGSPIETTYPIEHLGNTPSILTNTNHSFMKKFKSAKYPMIIIGNEFFKRSDSQALLNNIYTIIKSTGLLNSKEDWCGLNILNTYSNFYTGHEIGFVPGKSSIFNNVGINKELDIKLLYLMGVDGINENNIPKNSFIIYHGHHGGKSSYIADVILPSTTYIEKNATYVNLEGRSQETKVILPPPGESREDWKIIRALSEFLKIKLSYSNLFDLRSRLYDIAPNIKNINFLSDNSVGLVLFKQLIDKSILDQKHILVNIPFSTNILDFYQTNIISQSSRTMSKCSIHRKKSFSIYPLIK